VANHASAEKRNRQRVKRTDRNRSVRSEFRTLVKNVRELIAKGDAAGAKAALTPAISALDSAVTKGVLVRGTASRRVSRLAAAVHKLNVAAPAAK
jgi:small subunit ribosomal protein S20